MTQDMSNNSKLSMLINLWEKNRQTLKGPEGHRAALQHQRTNRSKAENHLAKKGLVV